VCFGLGFFEAPDATEETLAAVEEALAL